MESQPTAAAIERGDYLAVWIEGAGPNPDEGKVIMLANEFLRKHEQSRFAADVRMKLAETYFQRQDFPNAQTQFEILTRQEPNGPYAEKAFFFAGRAAMSSMGTDSLSRALELFDQVARKGGQLKWAARNEQAAIERKLGKPQDALPLYEEYSRIADQPRQNAKRFAVRPTSFSRWAQHRGRITNARLSFTISLRRTQKLLPTGAIRRCSKRAFAWKK